MEAVDTIKIPSGSVYTYEDIEDTILAVADKHGIEASDIVNIKMPRWQAILIESGKILFPRGSLKRADGINNAYDFQVVSLLSDIYLFLCNKYNKMVSLYGASLFMNINYETFKEWREGAILSDVAVSAKSKISEGMSGSIINKLYDSSNVTGQMMLANNLLGWNTSRSTNENTTKVETIATLEADLLTLTSENTKTIVQNDENKPTKQGSETD